MLTVSSCHPPTAVNVNVALPTKHAKKSYCCPNTEQPRASSTNNGYSSGRKKRNLLVFGHESLELRSVRASEFVDPGSALVELERRHGGNTACGSDVLGVVHVDLNESDVWVLRCHLLEHWRNHLARSAPTRGEIHDNELGLALLHEGRPLVLRFDKLHVFD
mmetsp:Transcript_17669/g.50615  ORF Transcript_17669/g.50615 Transcript_17669/m.50615 type:complete len:162 (+) Transcript_17669:161-646(+)